MKIAHSTFLALLCIFTATGVLYLLESAFGIVIPVITQPLVLITLALTSPLHFFIDSFPLSFSLMAVLSLVGFIFTGRK